MCQTRGRGTNSSSPSSRPSYELHKQGNIRYAFQGGHNFYKNTKLLGLAILGYHNNVFVGSDITFDMTVQIGMISK